MSDTNNNNTTYYEKSKLSLSLSLSNRLRLPNSPRLRRTGPTTYQSGARQTLSLSNGRQTLGSSKGFTIVELLVVIVIIGILAAITIVSYTGISSRATTASIQSDLTTASNQLKLFAVTNSAYPITNNCAIAESSTNICLKASGFNSYTYTPVNTSNPQAFHLTSTNGTTSYLITDNSAPYTPITCPTGYIVVPGNSTYGTADFCVMKYEAKNVGGVATSQAALTPWVSIPQTGAGSATTLAAAACTTCHLITEAEWLTIAQNVLNVASNWDNGAGVHAVGTGYIYSGNNDNVIDTGAGAALDADTNDSNGYYRTANVAPSNQKRTLTLSNGEVIWDLAGNVWEWTSGQVQSPIIQPGITGAGGTWRNWTAITNPGTLPINPSPATTGITGASTWTSTNGIGQIWSNSDEVALRGFLRGGAWSHGGYAGVLTLLLYNAPAGTGADIGFRVSR